MFVTVLFAKTSFTFRDQELYLMSEVTSASFIRFYNQWLIQFYVLTYQPGQLSILCG